MSFFKLISALVICTNLLTACGHESDNQTPSSDTSSFGSWSTMIGGTLATLSDDNRGKIESMDFYRVLSPVGFGVVHEFIGIVAKTSDGKAWALTTGLVGDEDDAYFRANLNNKNIALYFGSSSDKVSSQNLIRTISAKMNASPYHNQVYYASAMTMTPLFGRPCANVASELEALINRSI
jgi:hypothetical protein